MSKLDVRLTLAGLFVLAGCAAPVEEPERAGFLSDYSKLELVEDDHLSYVGDRMGEFDSFIIDSVVVLFERDPENPTFSDEEIEKFKAYVVKELTEQLTKDDGYSVVTEPGPGVARLRVGLTEVDETIGVLNVSIYTKITGLGLGGVSAEGEMVDSVTGEQIGALVRWGTGSRVLKAGLTPTGDAKIAIDKWAKNVRKILDEHHDKP